MYSESELGEIFGDYEILKIPIDQLIILPQVRGKANPVQSELTKSIRSSGVLMNPVDIALFSPDQLSGHLEFINGIWKTNASLDDYGAPNNGIYPVLIAGHSRVESIKAIQNETGQLKSVAGKLHDISSSAEFLSLQLAENTYGGINPERRAIAIVEMYQYGFDENANKRDLNHWSSYADFVRKNQGNISEEMLSDGMALTELSPSARDFIFAGKLYYGAGVEIGRNSKTIRQYVCHQLGEACNTDQIEKAYNYELAIMIGHLVDSRLNAKGGLKKAISYIKNKVSYMNSVINPPTSDDFQMSIINKILDAPNIQRNTYLESVKKEYRSTINRLKNQPIESVLEYLRLDAAMTGEDYTDDIVEIRKLQTKCIGNSALKTVMNGDDTKIR